MRKISRKGLLKKLYDAWREYIYKRDNYICQMCHRPCRIAGRVINAHHIVTKGSSGYAGKFDINNGVTLCFTCHKTDYVALGDFCKKWLKAKGLDYYELQNQYSEVAGERPSLIDIEIKLKVLEEMKKEINA